MQSFQKIQLKKNMSKITSKTKNIIIKTSKMKNPTEIINTRSITEAKKTKK